MEFDPISPPMIRVELLPVTDPVVEQEVISPEFDPISPPILKEVLSSTFPVIVLVVEQAKTFPELSPINPPDSLFVPVD
ncbi:MAG TPA: hypothetical protein PLA90_11470 [Candidatus Sumerlaeota bacterium]|nr:hypothetical protein [Candidatus Sumerlaeota bacterium]